MASDENRRRSFALPLIVAVLLAAGAALLYPVLTWVDCPYCVGATQPRPFSLSCFGCSGYGSVRLFQSWRLTRLASQP